MSEMERISDGQTGKSVDSPSGSLSNVEVYDKYGSMAYGIILQIVPQPHIAQEILISVFSSPLLQACNSYPFTFAVCVIKLARHKAVEAKQKLAELGQLATENKFAPHDKSPEAIFDLSFRQGLTPDEVAAKLELPKTEVLKAFRDFFKISLNY